MQRDIVQFIRSRYATVHQAVPPIDYQHFLSRMRSPRQGAALGFRTAAAGPLFLEQYLDQPVELALAPLLGTPVARNRIVEIGSLAATSGLAMLDLWLDAAHRLGKEADIGVAVLTVQLRRMFARLGIVVHELAPARQACVGSAGELWGTYYANDPVVCAGSLQQGRQRLEHFTARRRAELAL